MKHHNRPVFVIWLVYCALVLASPNLGDSAERFDIPVVIVSLLLVTLLLPIFIIWKLAVTGWWRFYEFANILKVKDKKRGYNMIATGLFIIVIHLIISALARSLYVFVGGDVTIPAYVMIKNYETVLAFLASFGFIFAGSVRLVRTLNIRIPLLTKMLNAGIPVALFALFYIYLVFSNPIRQTSNDPLVPATFLLPDLLIVGTIVIPSIITWAMGLLLVVNLEHYARYTKIASKRGIKNFYNGMLIIIATSILTQALSSLGGERAAGLGLVAVISILYFLVAAMAFGFWLISRGAKQLRTSYEINRKSER